MSLLIMGGGDEKKSLVCILAAVKLDITVSFMVECGPPTWPLVHAENLSHFGGFDGVSSQCLSFLGTINVCV